MVSKIRPGDILFFYPSTPLGYVVAKVAHKYSHVAVAINDHMMAEVSLKYNGVHVGYIPDDRRFDIIHLSYDAESLQFVIDTFHDQPYGIGQAISIGLDILLKIHWHTRYGIICSEFVARYLAYHGEQYVGLGSMLDTITPYQLYKYLRKQEVR